MVWDLVRHLSPQSRTARWQLWPEVQDRVHDGELGEHEDGQRAGGDQQEAAVELGLVAPVDCKGKRDGEGGQVEEGGAEKRGGAGQIGIAQVEAPHGDGGDGSDDEDGDAEGDAEPAESPMDTHVADADQRGLEDVEDHPGGKDDGMDREKERLGMAGMEELLIDPLAEAVDDDSGD
jgi:hypothetical protein